MRLTIEAFSACQATKGAVNQGIFRKSGKILESEGKEIFPRSLSWKILLYYSLFLSIRRAKEVPRKMYSR